MQHARRCLDFQVFFIVILMMMVVSIVTAQVTVINVIPNPQSGETNQDSEPNLAVNPSNTNQIAGSAFTSGTGFCGADLAPIFVSANGGNTWAMNCIVPSDASSTTSDITVRFGSTSNNFYAGILRRPSFFPRLNILSTNNFAGAAAMTVLVDRTFVDQPYVQAITDVGNDRVYVGGNDSSGPGGRTATIDQSQNAGVLNPVFNTVRIESRGTSGQDGPPIRPAIHPDGTVYAIFYGWRNITGDFNPNATITTDVVVVRDDNFGTGANPFQALLDAGDNQPGNRVVQNRTVPWVGVSQPAFGQERFVGSNISIAVDPKNSSTVYIAWADRVGTNDYTLHVRRSLDRGVTWSADLRTVTNATNPALAINDSNTVGFLYQQLIGTGANQRWVTHVQRTSDGFVNIEDLILANVPANAPLPQFIPYIGDYVHLMSIGNNFYGIFSANNTPNQANFPNGVTYQRNVNWATNTLLNVNNVTPVAASIDPFFFILLGPNPQIQIPGDVDLGGFCVGTTNTGTLNVCNTGKADLNVSAITSSNPNFSVTTPTSGFPVTISPDFCFPFQVAFNAASSGSQTSTFTISSNDPVTPNANVTISGIGSDPDIRVTGSTDFGIHSAWTPAEKRISVCNTGGCDLSVTAATVACPDFTLIHNPFPAKVSPDSCLDLVVRFTPDEPYSKSCDLTIISNDPDTPTVNRTLTGKTPPLFSVHGGLVIPHGALDNIAKLGSTINADFVYPFTDDWAWDLRLDFSRFDGEPGFADTDLTSLSSNLKFLINSSSSVRVFLNGGMGMYHFNPGDFEAGLNVGAGLNIPVGPRFQIEGTYNFHWAFTASPTLRFSQIQAGLLVSF